MFAETRLNDDYELNESTSAPPLCAATTLNGNIYHWRMALYTAYTNVIEQGTKVISSHGELQILAQYKISTNRPRRQSCPTFGGSQSQ